VWLSVYLLILQFPLTLSPCVCVSKSEIVNCWRLLRDHCEKFNVSKTSAHFTNALSCDPQQIILAVFCVFSLTDGLQYSLIIMLYDSAQTIVLKRVCRQASNGLLLCLSAYTEMNSEADFHWNITLSLSL